MKNLKYLWSFVLLLSISAHSQNLLPTIPNVSSNPFVATMFANVNLNTTTLSPNFFTLGEEAEQAAIAYCHPQSPHLGKAAYKTRLLFLLKTLLGSDKTDFSHYPQSVYAYTILKQKFPGDISASQKTTWETAIKKYTDDYIATGVGDRWKSKSERDIWYNSEVRWALGIYLSGIVLNNASYKSFASAFFDEAFQTKMFQPDGGINYVGFQNEVFNYHEDNIKTLAWYYLISGDAKIKSIIQKTVNYYPLMQQKNVPEFYTGASWKHYWSQSTGYNAAYIVASLTGSSHNYAVGKNASKNSLVAFFYNSALKDPLVPASTRYTVYDRNIQGPRARYDNWLYAGTSRKVDDGTTGATRGVGKSNLVGAMVLDDSGKWPLNAALDIASVEVRVAPGEDKTARRSGSDWLATNEVSTVTKSLKIYGLASKYNTSTKKASNSGPLTASNWEVKQEWVFTPERMLGMVEINATKDTEAYAVQGLLKFISGRKDWGTKKELVSKGNGVYTFGKINIKIRENTFGGALKQGYAEVYDAGDTSNKSTNLILKDNKSAANSDAKKLYKTTDKYRYIVEVYPEGTAVAKETKSLNSANLNSFSLDDGKRSIQIVHNYSTQQQTYTANISFAYKNAAIMKSWASAQSLGAVSGVTQVSVAIPANQHMLIINSNDNADLNSDYLNAGDVYGDGTDKVAVSGVSLSPASLSLTKGATGNVTASISPSNATNKSVSFSSSDVAVATVSQSGVVTAVAEGRANITATTADGSFTDISSIVVTTAPTGQTLVHMKKRNAIGFAIDGNTGGAVGQKVYLWTQNVANANQQWNEISRDGGYYSYQKANTTFCLDGNSGGANGQLVTLGTCTDTNQNQQWKKVDVGSSSYRLEKRNASGFSIDGGVGGALRQDVYLWKSDSANQNQHWTFTAL
jgi:uncharacterized protein YjdB